MGFEDLEHKITGFLKNEAEPVNNIQKTRIKEHILSTYNEKKDGYLLKIWAFLFDKKHANIVASTITIALILGFIPLAYNQSYAGEISPQGLVEIIRDGKKIVLDGKSKLKIGDEIIVSGNANAKLSLRNNFESEVFSDSKIKVDGRDNLFLVHGQLSNDLKSGTISTNKGEILAKSPSHFSVDVTLSGETKIMPQRNEVFVRNWNGEEIKLTSGEELRLRTDTELTSKIAPNDLDLSNIQIQAIRSKLFITRTKALNYVENRIIKSYQKANEDLISAQKTFKSIAQVLKSSRNMQALLPRENIEMLSNEDVYQRLAQKTNDKILLSEVKSVEYLLKIVESQKVFNFPDKQTNSLSFDRYVLVSRIFAKESAEIRTLGDILRKQYVTSFAKKVFNEELRIDQISVLNSEIKRLPQSTISKFFLLQVKTLLPIDLQELLEEKLEKDF